MGRSGSLFIAESCWSGLATGSQRDRACAKDERGTAVLAQGRLGTRMVHEWHTNGTRIAHGKHEEERRAEGNSNGRAMNSRQTFLLTRACHASVWDAMCCPNGCTRLNRGHFAISALTCAVSRANSIERRAAESLRSLSNCWCYGAAVSHKQLYLPTHPRSHGRAVSNVAASLRTESLLCCMSRLADVDYITRNAECAFVTRLPKA